jgi:hypothetical protein
MDKDLKKALIEAIAARDLDRLRKLRKNKIVYDFIGKYCDENGKGSIPPEAWMELQGDVDPEVWGNRKVQIIPGNDSTVFILPDNGRD